MYLHRCIHKSETHSRCAQTFSAYCLYVVAKRFPFCCCWIAVHTTEELKLTGNHLKGSRPLLSFSAEFEMHPHLQLLKELLLQVNSSQESLMSMCLEFSSMRLQWNLFLPYIQLNVVVMKLTLCLCHVGFLHSEGPPEVKTILRSCLHILLPW